MRHHSPNRIPHIRHTLYLSTTYCILCFLTSVIHNIIRDSYLDSLWFKYHINDNVLLTYRIKFHSYTIERIRVFACFQLSNNVNI